MTVFCPRGELLLTNPGEQGEGVDDFSQYQTFPSMLPVVLISSEPTYIASAAPEENKSCAMQGSFILLCGCDQGRAACLLAATAAVQGRLKHCAALAQQNC